MDYIKNILDIEESIKKILPKEAAEKITLIAAAKTQTSETVAGLFGIIGDIVENRVPEFLEHYDAINGEFSRKINREISAVNGEFSSETSREFLSNCDAADGKPIRFKWHFIGRLQTNKVKYLIGKDVLIHSLDREDLAAEINRLSLKNNVVTECLIEVNIGNEESKGGISAEAVEGFIESLERFDGIFISGLMSVLPKADAENTQRYYAELHKLFERVKTIKRKNFDCKFLSAGMSNDYKTAIAYGANMIRLGTAIFGARN
jgi:pyridoxal phosphate enzyme (YggS family)